QFRYARRMASTKLIWPQLAARSCFLIDSQGFYLNKTIYFAVPSVDIWHLLGSLQSNCTWFQISRIATPKLNGYFELMSQVLEVVRVPHPDNSNDVSKIAIRLSNPDEPKRLELEQELQDRVAALYGLTAEERKIVSGLTPAATAGRPSVEE